MVSVTRRGGGVGGVSRELGPAPGGPGGPGPKALEAPAPRPWAPGPGPQALGPKPLGTRAP